MDNPRMTCSQLKWAFLQRSCCLSRLAFQEWSNRLPPSQSYQRAWRLTTASHSPSFLLPVSVQLPTSFPFCPLYPSALCHLPHSTNFGVLFCCVPTMPKALVLSHASLFHAPPHDWYPRSLTLPLGHSSLGSSLGISPSTFGPSTFCCASLQI